MKNNELRLVLINTNRYNQGDTIPMGLIFISSYLKKYGDIQNIKILDVNFDDINSEIKTFDPHLIGISAMTIDYSKAIELAIAIKKFSRAPIMIGGVHISTLPSSLHESFDLGVIGEGEETLLELVNSYCKYGEFFNKNLENITGIIYRENGEFVTTDKREPIKPLDKIPKLDKSLINKNYLKKRNLPDGSYGVLAPLLTGRGCPFNCVFCSTRIMWGCNVRVNSPERVAEEIKDYVKNYEAKYLTLWDDLLVNRARLKEMVQIFKREKINLSEEEKKNISKQDRIDIPINCNARVDVIDDEVCQLLKEIGVVKVGFGFESGSDNYLRYLKMANATLEQTHKAIQICKRHGLLVSGSLIFGGPGESVEDMKKTLELIDFMIKEDIENVWSFVMTPFPGTKIWEIAKQRNKVNESNMNWDLLSHQNIDNPLLLDDSVSIEEFKKLFWESRKKQRYFKWKKIKYEIMNHPLILIKTTIRKPGLALSLLFKKKIKEN